jgi:steroid 5-alpha reductase family enzyme
MGYFNIYLQALAGIIALMTILWIISIIIKNVSIVDYFWGPGFIFSTVFYFFSTGEVTSRKLLLLVLVALWGIRLSGYLVWRNRGKGEDFRYRQIRKDYGENRYWWISFPQTFLLQGILMWLISAPLLGAQLFGEEKQLSLIDAVGVIFWITGFIFETGGDLQLASFKSDPSNKGKVLDKGFWKYTRHPNYFGDASVWWGYALFSISAGSYVPVLGSVLMTLLIIKVSGVALLEKSLSDTKPQYREYIRKTSAFLPWFPRK